MNTKTIYSRVVLLLIIIIVLILANFFRLNTIKKSNNIKNERNSIVPMGIGTEFNTEEYYGKVNLATKDYSKYLKKESPEFFANKLWESESLILANITKNDSEKMPIAVAEYNTAYKINEGILKSQYEASKSPNISQEYNTVLSRSIVATYEIFEVYCFRSDWFLSSLWSKSEVFAKYFKKYPKEEIMPILLGFSDSFTNLSLQDSIVVTHNMRVVSYLLHSFPDKLSTEDKEILVERLIKLRNVYSSAPLSKIYGTDFARNIQLLVVTPSVEYAYATEVLSRYRPDLVPKALVVKTYEENIAKIKKIVDENNKPIYMVNKFMWIHLMYLGYLYEQNDFKKTNNKMFDLTVTIDNYTLQKSPVKEGRETATAFQAAANTELGNWDQIRKRAYSAVEAVKVDIRNNSYTR